MSVQAETGFKLGSKQLKTNDQYFASQAADRRAGGSSSQACVKTKLWLGRDAIKRFVFWAGPVNYSFQKMVQMEG